MVSFPSHQCQRTNFEYTSRLAPTYLAFSEAVLRAKRGACPERSRRDLVRRRRVCARRATPAKLSARNWVRNRYLRFRRETATDTRESEQPFAYCALMRSNPGAVLADVNDRAQRVAK